MRTKNNTHKVLKNILGEIDVMVIFYLIMITTSLAWIPESLIELLKSCCFDKDELPQSLLYILMFIVSSITLLAFYFLAKESQLNDFEDATNLDFIRFEQDKVLIIFLSNFNPTMDSNLHESRELADFKKTNIYMPLVAIEKHIPKIKYLQVICSSDSKKDFDEFKNIVQNLFSHELEIKSFGNNINFEKLNDVQKILEEVYEYSYRLTEKEEEIIIDITGGPKMVSIAGAYYTLFNNRRLQYVSTTDYQVLQYNNKRVD